MGLRIDIVTIFPEYFGSPLGVSLIGKAAARGDIEFGVHDLRRWATDVHHTVDDLPFGGGPGMVMKPDLWGDALDEIVPADGGSARLVVPTPSGVPFTQDIAAGYAAEPRLVFACGRYEGIDERVRESLAFIRQHPLWYAGVMLGRMWGMLKVAGDPVPYTGVAGINVTSTKCLPPERQGGVLAFAVNLLGSIQSLARYLFLPLVVLGLVVALRADWRMSCLLLVTILYYLVAGTSGHTEVRYVVPMHGLLAVFAGAVVMVTCRRART